MSEETLEPGDLIVCHPDDYSELVGLCLAGGVQIRSSAFVPVGRSLHVKAAALAWTHQPDFRLPQTVAEWEAFFTQPAARLWFWSLLAAGVPMLVAAQKVLERLCGLDNDEIAR